MARMSRRIFFPLMLTVMSCAYAGLNFYAWARLVRDPAIPEPWFSVVTWLFVAMAVSMPLVRILGRGKASVERLLGTPTFIWMGGLFITFAVLVVTDVARAVLGLVAPGAIPDPRTWAAGVLISVVTLVVWSLVTVKRGPSVKTVEVTLKGLPRGMDGTTLVQWTDVHIGPSVQREHVEKMVAQTNALAADAVVITGDLVDGPLRDHRGDVQPLADLKAKRGVFFVTGNHEYFRGVDAWLPVLSSLGLRVLRNERVALDGVDLVGIDDYNARDFVAGHGADLKRALAGRDPSRPTVLLAHQPRAVHEASELGVDLQLSGHTHAGQIWPWNLFVRLQQPYVAGLVRHGATQLYISAGTGFWGPPMRLGTRSEITKIVLRAQA